jgi:hypothetical protein
VGTTFVEENKDSVATCTEFAQSKARSPDRRVRFPVTVEFYDQRAKVYAPAKNFAFYRVAFKVDGKRRMLTFGTYSEAKTAAEAKVKELHKGQKSSALTAKQAQDALTIRDMLDAYPHPRIHLLPPVKGLLRYVITPDHRPRRFRRLSFPQNLHNLLRTVSFAFHVLPFYCSKTHSLASPLFGGQVITP